MKKNIFLILIIAAGVWLANMFWDSPPEYFFGKRKSLTEKIPVADSYMKSTLTTKYDETGVPTYILKAENGLYYTVEDRFELSMPQLTFSNSQSRSQPWQLTADKASTENSGQQVHLTGKVHAFQKGDNGRSEFKTTELFFNPEENTAYTVDEVSLIHPSGTTTGTGMEADFSAETYKLLSKVKGKYHGK